MACARAGLLGGGNIIFGGVLLKLFGSTDSFRLVAVILGVEVQVLIQVFFFVALVGVEEDVLIIIAGGVGLVRVNCRVDGV